MKSIGLRRTRDTPEVAPRRTLLAASAVASSLVAALLLCSAGVFAAPPAPGSLFLATERIAREDGSFAVGERGHLFVPLNRSVPSGDLLSVEVYRFPAAAEVPAEQPPIFVLNGGPGFPGLEPALERPGFFEGNIETLTALAEVVVVGQRGIGSSRPNTICEPAPSPFLLAKNCRTFWEEKGLDLQGFTVVEAAADVRDVAFALGYEQIVLSGGSFGSHWAMAVMRNHPEIVARALLHGLEGPDHTYDMPSGILAALERMAEAAESSEQVAEHVPEGGLLAGFERALQQAAKGAARATVEHPAGGEPTEVAFLLPQVKNMLFGYSSNVRSRSRIAGWPADLIALANGDYARAAQVKLQKEVEAASEEAAEDPEREREPRFYRTASYFMLDCSSGISSARHERLQNDPAIRLVGNTGSFYDMVCRAFDADLGEQFRHNFDTEIPTLLVHGTWDVSTPYQNAVELAPHFRRGKLVTIEGGSHGALGEAIDASPEFLEGLQQFLRAGDLDGVPQRVVLPAIEWEAPNRPAESSEDLEDSEP